MTTVIPGLFQINGVVSTDKSVLQNINAICTAAGCWMTYDITEGKWSVIMNRAGASVASFNDANIIGGITVSGKGINELYNSVTIEFPHKDLRDQTDYIDFDIAAGERFPNELDNKLNLSTDLANDPIQAQYIAGAELKQSRVDKVIQFRTDFSMLGLKAGDLIDVTASMYGYSGKMFRITRIEEDDSDVLQLSITALEYDADVYSTADLNRKIRSKKTGITPKAANQTLYNNDSFNVAKQNVNGSTSYLTPALIASGGINAYMGLLARMNAAGLGADAEALAAMVLSLVDNGKFTPTIDSWVTARIAITPISQDLTISQWFDWDTQFPPRNNDRYDLGKSTTLPYTGRYKADFLINYGGPTVDAYLRDNIRKRARMALYKNGADITSQLGIGSGTTIPKGDDPFNDLLIAGYFTANKNDVITYFCDLRSDLNFGVDNSNVFSFVYITNTLTYLGS
jgi:hypothetical protein